MITQSLNWRKRKNLNKKSKTLIEIDCRICENCTGESCKVYGDDADIAVRSCAQDEFKNYKERES
jgi:hypothetical protein